MFATAAEALAFLDAHKIDLVDLLYVDLYGGVHGQTLPRSWLGEQTFVEGVGVDGSSVPGMGRLEAGDRSLLPDPTSFFQLTEGPHRKLAVLCDLCEADTKAPLASAPRTVARRAEALLRDSGVATHSRWGPELEYYVFDRVELVDRPEHTLARFHSAEAGWTDAPGGPVIAHKAGYHAVPPLDRLMELRDETVRRLERAGVPVALHHHEVGEAGQVEIEIGFDGLLAAGDHVVKGKLIAKQVAAERGLRATFLPKPLHGHPGSGLHFHQHLFDGARPLFDDPGAYGGLSAIGRAWTAGLLAHGSALLAWTNPSTNSYRRLVPGFEAPVRAFFSLANRSAAVRIPGYARTPEARRVEFRPPDATCNPYLALAAMQLAGLDGVRRGMDPTALGFGPFDTNAEHLPPAQRDRIQQLPTRLGEAMDALAADHAFLLQGEVFSPALVQAWIDAGRAAEADLATRPHPHELARYVDC